MKTLDSFHRLALLALASNLIYIIWLLFNVGGELGIIFLMFELMTIAIIPLFIFNHWQRKFQLLGGRYSLRSSVDIFIPTVNEDLDMLRQTIEAAQKVVHPRLNIYVLDDGNRPSLKKLTEQLGVNYLARPNAPLNAYKAANLNFGLKHSRGDFILVIDADNIVTPNILDDLLGHFSDDKVGIVASRQSFNVPKHDFNHDHLFYNSMQNGKNSDGVAISCGSGVIYRRSSLQQIDGFSEWNMVEDLFTTYIANSNGIKTVYVSQSYVTGHAPQDIASIYKQRGTWATDTLRMFFWRFPFANGGLNLRQRLHYFELGYCYIVSGVVLSGVYLINFVSLAGNIPIVTNGYIYVLLRVPSLIFTLMFFQHLSQSQLTSRVWAGLFPVYFKSILIALTTPYHRPKYIVTSKVDYNKREVSKVMAQLGFLLLGYTTLALHYVLYGLSSMLAVSGFWVVFMTYWLIPVISRGLNVGSYKIVAPAPIGD